MQLFKQQLRTYEQSSQQQLTAQPDVDTKMSLLPGLGQDRQLPAVMAGIHKRLLHVRVSMATTSLQSAATFTHLNACMKLRCRYFCEVYHTSQACLLPHTYHAQLHVIRFVSGACNNTLIT